MTYSRRMLMRAAAAVPLLAGLGWAQQTCVTIPSGTLTSYSLERRVPLSAFSTTQTPNVPADVLAQITSGALEVRERLIYNAQNNQVTSTWFTQAPSATFPTPLTTNLTGSTLQVFAINAANTLVTGKPQPNVMFFGTVANVNLVGPFGDFTGAPAMLSTTFTQPTDSSTPQALSNVLLVVGGTFSSYTADATGSIVATLPPSGGGGGGGGGGNGPTADAGPNMTTTSSVVIHDGSKSTGTAPLTYAWTMASTSNKQAAISGANTVMPQAFLGDGAGDYVFQLTVTDANGATATATTTVSYNGGR